MRDIGMAVLLVLASGSPGAAAETPGPMDLAGGDRVRLTLAGTGGRLAGTILEMDRGALVVRGAEGDARRVALAGVERLEVARGRRGHVVEGALVGFVPGFVYGFRIGRALGCDDQGPECSSLGPALAAGSMVGGITAAGGALVGLAVRTQRWVPVRLPGARRPATVGVALAPLPGGVAAGVSLTF